MTTRQIRGGALSAAGLVCALAVSASLVRAQSALPTGWASRDIGSTGQVGSASVSSGTWTITGSGANIWGTSDEFRFAYQQITGDVDIRVRLASLEDFRKFSKAGVMIRETLNADSRNAFMLFRADRTLFLQSRSRPDGSTTALDTFAGAAPVWLRLVRRGSEFTGYFSSNGTSWTTAGTATINMAAASYVGLAVTSRMDSALSTARFTNLQVSDGQVSDGDMLTTTTLPAPWTGRDIGSPALAGSASAASGTFTVTAGGIDIWGTSDQFHFVYQPLQGDVEVIARVASLQYADPWSKAGVMIRETLTGASRHVSMMATGTQGLSFPRRVETGGTTYGAPYYAGAAPRWVRLVREGNLFSGYTSTDGATWALVEADTVAMASTVYVGLALTSHDTAQRATATFTNVTARTPTTGTNQPPTVSITSPAAGSTFAAPAAITVRAAASDTDGAVTKVDFYRDTQWIGSDTTNSYSASLTGVGAGTYQFTAVATDSDGATSTSSPVSVTVSGATNQPPTVSLTSPAPSSTFTAGASITLAATASDDGMVSGVDFYRGSTKMASDTSSPYSYTWTNVAAGSYQLTAVAWDDEGAMGTSSVINITVSTTPNQLPTVSITSPISGQSFAAPASLTITAAASDSDGSIAKVEFYAGSQLIATDTTSQYQAAWNNVAAGSYSLKAVAYDNRGGTRESGAVAVTITAAAPTPTKLVFTASADHETSVSSYTVAIYRDADVITTASPVATRDIGKPTPVGGDITVDISTLVNPLPAGTYKVVVRATGPGGTTASAPATFTK